MDLASQSASLRAISLTVDGDSRNLIDLYTDEVSTTRPNADQLLQNYEDAEMTETMPFPWKIRPFIKSAARTVRLELNRAHITFLTEAVLQFESMLHMALVKQIVGAG